MAEEKQKSDKGEVKVEVTKDANRLIAQFQIAQQQLQSILLQKDTLNVNKIEIEQAMKELEKTPDKTAYKITGNIMVSKSVKELKKELENTKEAVEIRIKSLEKNEKRLVEQLKDMQESLKKIIK